MSRTRGEILRYGCVGIAATAVHYGVLTLLVEGLGILPTLANGGAFCLALLVTFFGQSRWVFRAAPALSQGLVAKFAASVFGGFLGNVAIMFLATEVLELPYRAGFLAGLVLVPALTFVLNKYWVFRQRKELT